MNRYRILALLALAGLCSTVSAAAPQKTGRFTLDVKISALSRVQGNNGSHATVKIAESVRLAYSTEGSGELGASNPFDMSVASDLVARQNAANEKAAKANAPSEAKQQEMAAHFQKAVAACNNNISCLQRVQADMQRATASWYAPSVATSADMARLQDERYLTFFANAATCKGEYNASIKNSFEGAQTDVQGLVPFTRKDTGEGKGRELDMSIVCNGGQVVYDVKTNKIWAYTNFWPIEGQTFTSRQGTRDQTSTTQLNLNSQAMDWVGKQLLAGVPRSGKQSTKLRYPSRALPGIPSEVDVTVEMSWNFEGK